MSKRYKAKRRERYHRSRWDYTPPCWCGVRNPYFAPVHHETCDGTGVLNCYCGGDQCVCHNHGEAECFGCADCGRDDDQEFYDEQDEWNE